MILTIYSQVEVVGGPQSGHTQLIPQISIPNTATTLGISLILSTGLRHLIRSSAVTKQILLIRKDLFLHACTRRTFFCDQYTVRPGSLVQFHIASRYRYKNGQDFMPYSILVV